MELLAVVGLLSAVLAATVPAVRGMAEGSGRVAAIDRLMGLLDRTRCEAIAKGRPAYLVVAPAQENQVNGDDRDGRQSVSIFLAAEDPAQPPVRLTPWSRMPTGVSIDGNPDLPSLLTAPEETTPPVFAAPGGEGAPAPLPYFGFGPTGALLHPSDSRRARVYLATQGQGEAANATDGERIEVSTFTGIARYRHGE